MQNKIQVEEKLRSQITQHAENHKASQSQLEQNLNLKIEELDRQNDNYLDEISTLKSQVQSQSSEQERLKNQISAQNDKQASQSRELSNLQNKASQLQQELVQRDDDSEYLKNQTDTVITDLNSNIQNLRQVDDQNKVQINSLEKRIKDKDKKI